MALLEEQNLSGEIPKVLLPLGVILKDKCFISRLFCPLGSTDETS